MREEYDLFSKGLHEEAEPAAPDDGASAPAAPESATPAGYEQVFDLRVGLQPATLIPLA